MSKSSASSEDWGTLHWFACRSCASCGSVPWESQLGVGGHRSCAPQSPLGFPASLAAAWCCLKPPHLSWRFPVGLENTKCYFPLSLYLVLPSPSGNLLSMERDLWDPFLQKSMRRIFLCMFLWAKLQTLLTLNLSRALLMGTCYGKTALSSPGTDSNFAFLYHKKIMSMLLNTTSKKKIQHNELCNSNSFVINEHKDMVSSAKAIQCGCEAILFRRNIYHHITSS